MIVLNFCSKELRLGVHADSIVLVDFLHVLGSIEGGFISSPNSFKQTFGLFCHNYGFVNSSRDVLYLGVFDVDKGGQGGVMLFVNISGSLDGLLISSETRRSIFIFSLSILWYLRKVTVALV